MRDCDRLRREPWPWELARLPIELTLGTCINICCKATRWLTQKNGRLWSQGLRQISPFVGTVDVLERSADGAHYLLKCAGKARQKFWMSTQSVKKGIDPEVALFEVIPEPPEKEQLRTQEVCNLKASVLCSECWPEVQKFDGFVTAKSRCLVKVTRVPQPQRVALEDVQTVDLRDFQSDLEKPIYEAKVQTVDESFCRVRFSMNGIEREGICHLRDSGAGKRTSTLAKHVKVGESIHVICLCERDDTIYVSMAGLDRNRRKYLDAELELLMEQFFFSGRSVVEELGPVTKETFSSSLCSDPDTAQQSSTARRDLRHKIMEKMFEKRSPPALIDFHKYMCYAEFGCGCGNTWETVRGWGVYDGENDYEKCTDCLDSDGEADKRIATCCVDMHRKRMVGCLHLFKSVEECVQDTTHRGSGIWTPKRDAGTVTSKCKECNSTQRACTVEVYYNQPGGGRHKPELCPECRLRGTWCAPQDPDQASASFEMLLRVLHPDLSWVESESGLQCTFNDHQGRRWLLQMVPELFIIPDSKDPTRSDLYEPSGQDREVLRGDRVAAGVDEGGMMRKAVEGISFCNVVQEGGDGFHDTPLSGAASSSEGVDPSSLRSRILDFKLTMSSMSGKLLKDDVRAYSFRRAPGQGLYGNYGTRHGVTFYKPAGFVRLRCQVENFSEVRDWPIVFHGTSIAKAGKIVYDRMRKPGSRSVPEPAHGQAGSEDGCDMYFSPALGVSSHPVYSPFDKIADDRWRQAVLVCKLRPGCWRSQSSTLNFGHWPRNIRIDPNFPDYNNIEFLVSRQDDVCVTGVLIREFGAGIDKDLFGELPSRVKGRETRIGHRGRPCDGPEFEWTELLRGEYEREGYFIGARCPHDLNAH